MADQMDIIQMAVRETIKNELRLDVKNPGGQLSICLMLGDEVIGKPYRIDTDIKYIGDDDLDVEFEVDQEV